MRLEHRFVVPVPVEQAWDLVNDLEQLVPCFPGAALSSSDEAGFAGSCKVKLGPVALQYNGTGRYVERDAAARRMVVEAKGKDKRGNGTAAATVTAVLTGAGSGTEVSVGTDLTVTGRPAQFGRGLIQDVSDRMLDQFVDCLTGKLAGLAPSAAEPSAAEPSAAEPDPGPAGGAGPGPPEPAALDLGTAVLPVIARRVVPYLIGAVVALLLQRLLRRR